MASDPRLNLSFNAQVNIGPISISIGAGADSCPTSLGQNLFAQTSASSAASSILPGNIGAFANLQLGLGGGTVGVGLSNLAAISNSIRINGPPTATNPQGLPTSTDPNAGNEFVLAQVGLSSQGISAVAQVNTSVANTANIQAGLVYNQVQSGTFTNANIPTAFSAFQNATQVLSSIFSPGSAASPPGSGFGTMCGASPYALDLINVAPKYKFLFVVQLQFDPQFQEVMSSIDPAFVVKMSTRPQVEFEYQDVNMYNFRTKVPVKTVYPPMTMKFYDDDYNNAFQFYATYMKLMSPIANIDIESQSVDPLDAYDNAGGGMGFNQATQKIQTGWSQTLGQGYAGSLGPYGTDPTIRNVLRKITLYQVYKQGRMMNVFNFYNPKITAITLDDMDMTTAGEGNEVSFTFSYDSVFIIPGYNIITGTTYNLPSITNDGIYPFGLTPGSVSPGFSSKDGIGGGIDFGQNNVLANASAGPSSAGYVPPPSTVSNFDSSNPTTVSGTNLSNLAPAPAATGGGSDTSSTIQGNTPDNLSEITTTTPIVPDPVTGTTAESADNSGNVGNVVGQSASALDSAQSAYSNAVINGSIEEQNAAGAALRSAQANAAQTSQSSTTYTSSGTSSGSGGSSGISGGGASGGS